MAMKYAKEFKQEALSLRYVSRAEFELALVA